MRHLWVSVVFSAVGWAQPALSLREAVSDALANHPLLAASAEQAAAAEGLRVQAGLRPNPRLVVQTENLRAHGSPGFRYGSDADTFAYLSQVFETAGKRGHRVEVASANLRKAQLDRELLSRRIANRVRAAYWSAAAAERSAALLLENIGTFRQILHYHEVRVREGAMAEADLLRVRLESERLEISAGTVALEADRARIHLFREMGKPEFPEVRFSEPVEPSEADLPRVDVARALENRTEMKIARAALEQALAGVRLQHAAARPDLDVLFGYKRSQGFHTVLGGVQINLPVSDRNQGNIVAAEREIKVAEANLAATEALVRAEVQAARREFEIRRRMVLTALPNLNDHAQESSKISLAAYREGGADLLRLLDSERVRIETHLLHMRTLAEYQQSRVALETALGVEP
jgi:cobalt-zinc-cadmium efflux system outer membrane protein